MSAYKIQTPGNYPEESIQHSEHRESLKSRMYSVCVCVCNTGYSSKNKRPTRAWRHWWTARWTFSLQTRKRIELQRELYTTTGVKSISENVQSKYTSTAVHLTLFDIQYMTITMVQQNMSWFYVEGVTKIIILVVHAQAKLPLRGVLKNFLEKGDSKVAQNNFFLNLKNTLKFTLKYT